mmetsp:Transcript_144692/g.360660  ORF Transcript_144692/g.360660 Transcript_144692/m.360660 type:complete len:302 (-) Transcript_144692:428-1333(-)
MGCGASASLKAVKTTAQVRQNVVDEGPREDSKLPVLHEEADPRCDMDDIESLASSAGRTISSYVSAVTSRHMFPRNYRSERPDDMQSDVPTIAESIADMQDLIELGNTRSEPLRSSPTSTLNCQGGSGSGLTFAQEESLFASMAATTMIVDNRPHPLAPMSCSEPQAESSHAAIVGDLGVLSDVPSIRDDMSISSAASDIVVTFPPGSSSFTGLGSTTPTTSERGPGSSTPTSSSRGTSGVASQAKLRDLHLALREGQNRCHRSGSLQLGGRPPSIRSDTTSTSERRYGGGSRRLSSSFIQ